jgi:hypothetical protein
MPHVKDNRLNLWHHIYDPFSDFQRTTPMFIGTYKIPILLCCRRKVLPSSDGPATLLLDLPKRKSPETKGLFQLKMVEAAGIE